MQVGNTVLQKKLKLLQYYTNERNGLMSKSHELHRLEIHSYWTTEGKSLLVVNMMAPY